MRNGEIARLTGLIVSGALLTGMASSIASAADGVWLASTAKVSATPAGKAGKAVSQDPFFRSADAKTLKLMQDQHTLSQAADVVRWEVERSGATGYTSLRLEEGAVVLRWNGAIPARIQHAITKASRIAPVYVESAKFSRAELRAAAQRLSESMEANSGSPFHSVVIVDDRAIQLVAHPGSKAAGIALDRAQAALPQVSVPVEVAEGEPLHFTSRLDDSAPWWGGARIQSWRNGAFRASCSSGFGVRDGAGYEYILTAAHCATYPDRIQDPAGEYIGGVGLENYGLDILLIPTNAEHRIYDGGVGSGEFSKAVSGWGWVYANEWLCQSGSVSGAVCGIQATNNFTYSFCDTDSDGDWTCMRDLIVAYKRDGGIASRHGDSGGPVFSLDGARVVAKGTLTGGNGGSMMVFQDFGTAWNLWGVTPLTGY